jgi:hypothetical protein
MKKIVLILTLFLTLTLLLSGCGKDGGEETTVGEEITTAPETEKPLNTEPKQTAVVPSPNWGFPVHAVKTLDEAVVTAELDGENVILTSYNPGETEVHVLDCFEHKAVIKVTVADDADCSITFEAKPCEEDFINAANYGVMPGSSPNNLPDQASKLQMVIDKVWKQGGGTVFLYPGFYKISVITMRDGVTLRMYSGFTDAREGYTVDLAEKVKKGEVTVLVLARVLNTKMKEFGRNGSSNFTLSGGVIDNDHSQQSTLLFGLSKGITVENMIFKDMKNNHVIQITGCDDVTVRNCIFAGFEWGDTFTREVIQVEQSHPGAHSGDHANAPVRFEQGEIFGCNNITIDSCYFGPSDELPGPHIAIGHHGTAHEPVADGFKITNNVFDRPSFSAIRFANIVDVEISGNTFIATKNSNKLCTETSPAFIILYSNTNTLTYNNVVDGRKITYAMSYEQSGTHNVNITDNEFYVEKDSDKRIIIVTGSTVNPGVHFESSVLRQLTYDSKPYLVTGYFKSTNYIGNISFCDNKITYNGQPDLKDYIFRFYRVFGYKFENNEIKLNECAFTRNEEGIHGMFMQGCYLGEKAETYTINSVGASNYIAITQPDGREARLIFTTQNTHKLIAGEGGRIELSKNDKGNVIVHVIPEEGYSFSHWQTAEGVFDKTGSTKIAQQLELKAVFTKK